MTKYSKELIQRCIVNFKEEHNLVIDEETADQYLDSFASLFLAFSNDVKKE